MNKYLIFSMLFFSLTLAACSNNGEVTEDSDEGSANNNESREEGELENEGDSNGYASDNREIDEQDTGDNLIDYDNVEEESWITYEGYISNWNDEYLLTESFDYNPSKDYLLTHHAYVSYFDDDEFIETILHSEGFPRTIENVEEANNIRVSYNERDQGNIELREVE